MQPSPFTRTAFSLIWPTAVGGLLSVSMPRVWPGTSGQLWFLLGLGAMGVVLGRQWYDWPELGLRTGRPLMAGVGFAFLGWLIMLGTRIWAIDITGFGSGLGVVFLYLLLVEAACVQFFSFGLFFRALSDWRPPLTTVLLSGLVYGLLAYGFFGEAAVAGGNRWVVLFFIVWGWMYGMIRLRTGSWLGMALVQAMQTLTVWHLMLWQGGLISAGYFYVATGALYLLIAWRLLPKYRSDLRI